MLTQTKVPELTLVQSAPDPDVDRKPRRLSDILQEIADGPATPDERISLGHLIEGFGNRAFGALLFIFAVPVALPIAIPGISAALGAPLLFLSWQLMRGREQPWLPEVTLENGGNRTPVRPRTSARFTGRRRDFAIFSRSTR